MLVEIRTLAETTAFRAVLANATGFMARSSMDSLQRMRVKTDQATGEFLRSVKDNRVILLIHRLYKPYDNIKVERNASAEYLARIEGEYMLAGNGNLAWIIRNDIPFILLDTLETAVELDVLRRHTPPLYKKLQAVRLKLSAPDGRLDTSMLESMGASNPDRDRDGEQTLYGDLLDRIRDMVGWKDHDLAVRLIGEYAVRGRWNGSGVERPETKDTP